MRELRALLWSLAIFFLLTLPLSHLPICTIASFKRAKYLENSQNWDWIHYFNSDKFTVNHKGLRRLSFVQTRWPQLSPHLDPTHQDAPRRSFDAQGLPYLGYFKPRNIGGIWLNLGTKRTCFCLSSTTGADSFTKQAHYSLVCLSHLIPTFPIRCSFWWWIEPQHYNTKNWKRHQWQCF